jgi:hypothetical protein
MEQAKLMKSHIHMKYMALVAVCTDNPINKELCCQEWRHTGRMYVSEVVEEAVRQGCVDTCKAPYTLSVKLSDFTVWHHTWRKNWLNCAVLTGNSAGLRTVLSSRLSNRELRSSLRESHSHVFIHRSHTHKKTHRTDQKKLTNLMGKLCCARGHSVQFLVQFFFTQINFTV